MAAPTSTPNPAVTNLAQFIAHANAPMVVETTPSILNNSVERLEIPFEGAARMTINFHSDDRFSSAVIPQAVFSDSTLTDLSYLDDYFGRSDFLEVIELSDLPDGLTTL